MLEGEAQDVMLSALRQEVYGAARAYHAAVARYARALARHRGVEAAAQAVVGTSLRYHVAVQACLPHATARHFQALHERLEHMRRLLEAASRHYDALRRSARGGI